MPFEFGASVGNAMGCRIAPAAVEGPVIDADSPADHSRRSFLAGAPQGNIGLSFAEIEDVLLRVDLEQDLGMLVMQFLDHRREQRDRENLLGRQPDAAAKAPLP